MLYDAVNIIIIIAVCYYSWGTMEGHKLTREQHILTILSMVLLFSADPSDIKKTGIIFWRIVYFCLRTPIILSTWILTTDNSLLRSTSIFSGWFFPFVDGGVFTSAITILAYSSQVKPLSANITSPKKKKLHWIFHWY